MRTGYRQEVLNVLLAQLLQERGVVAAPESVLRSPARDLRRIPDVLVNFQGLRTAIEGEVGDNPNAERQALQSASERVAQGIAHIGIAIVYPSDLRTAGFEDVKARLATARLSVAIVTESGQTAFAEGNVESLETALRHAFQELVREDVVGKAAAALDEGVEFFAAVVVSKSGWILRLARALGIQELPKRHKVEEDAE